jgi:molecular chaperone DnaJ
MQMDAPREWFEKDYYEVLGVAADASPKEITKAYRKLARELHPDQNPGDSAAEERFKDVSAAYDVLGDETKRPEYDEVRRLGPMAGGMPNGGGPGGFSFNVGDMQGGGDISDLLGQMFGGGADRRAGRGGVGPQRGADLTAQLTLDFEDAAVGLTTTLYLTSDAQCSTCSGSGSKPGTAPNRCGVCGGRGVLDDNQGMFSFSSPCRACQGSGAVITDPCSTCHGSGVERRPREVKARIPAGVRNGQTIRLAGRGAPGRNGGPAGDLLVEVTVRPHETFGRAGQNLTVTVPISFADAALGAEIGVPILDGSTVKLRLKPGTQSGSRHRVKGHGITSQSKRNGTKSGDLIVTVNVQVPTELNDAERAAIEQLAAATTLDAGMTS